MGPASHYKSSIIERRAKFMHPFMQQILNEMLEWLKAEGVHGVVTETITTLKEDAALGRKSVTHREGRAFDLRTRDWDRKLLKRFLDHFNKKYGKYGSLGTTTMQPTLLVHHDAGHGEHIHVQLMKQYAVKVPKDLDVAKIA